MQEIRRLIQETLEKSGILEDAQSFIDIPPSAGLVISKNTKDSIWLNLFDFKAKRCIGIITLRNYTDRAWGVTTVAAEKGLGPRMYELGMMAVYPSGLCTDRNGPTKEGAISVWKRFVDNRPDVKKTKIKPGDIEYSQRNIEDEERNFLENIICQRNKSIWFDKLVTRGETLMRQYDITPEQVSDTCREYFSNRYDNG